MDRSVLDGMIRDAKDKINTAFEKGYKQGMADVVSIPSDKIDEAYENGLNDAWETARKIYFDSCDGGLDADTIHEIFGYFSPNIIVKNFSASETVKRIKEWEESKNEIKVGDEIVYADGTKGIVVGVSNYNEEISVLSNEYAVPQLVNKNKVKKTDKHFDQIEEVLKKMQEDV